MPVFKGTIGFDCPCYGDFCVEADSLEDAIRQVKSGISKGEMPNDWDTHPDVGCENFRIFDVTDESGEAVLDHQDIDPFSAV